VGYGLEPIEAAKVEGDGAGDGQPEVKIEKAGDALLNARGIEFCRIGAGFPGKENFGSSSEEGKDGDEKDDNTESTNPLGDCPPEEQRARKAFQVAEDGGPGSGEAGSGLEDGGDKGNVGENEIIRECPEDTGHDPAEPNNGEGLLAEHGVRSGFSQNKEGNGAARGDNDAEGESGLSVRVDDRMIQGVGDPEAHAKGDGECSENDTDELGNESVVHVERGKVK